MCVCACVCVCVCICLCVSEGIIPPPQFSTEHEGSIFTLNSTSTLIIKTDSMEPFTDEGCNSKCKSLHRVFVYIFCVQILVMERYKIHK